MYAVAAIFICIAAILLYRLTSERALPSGSEIHVPAEEGVLKDPSLVRDVVKRIRASAAETVRRETALTVKYPVAGSIFPPDMTAPSFRWIDSTPGVQAWVIFIELEGNRRIYAGASGTVQAQRIDERCVSEQNPVQPLNRGEERVWTPGEDLWSTIRKYSVTSDAVVKFYGTIVENTGKTKVVSSGGTRVRTSADPVGAPIFYRDVPLMPSKTEEGLIKPLAKQAIPLIEWRLRDVSNPESVVVMKDMPTCANCHSFSMDGNTLGMDMDGPRGDKGAYTVVDVEETMVIEEEDVFSWNTFEDKIKGRNTLGLMSQVSPDGRYVVSTVNESVFVCNYMDFRFLQTFYPTRGILAVYSRETGEIRRLPGADDSRYVQACPVWTPDGNEIIFMRAKARPAYGSGPLPKKANDLQETQIQYDLYRIPFNAGRGGKAEPIAGASRNGMSNSFAKCSPDGKWIVFVQCRNGMLMRPDSRLYIIPSRGGKAREMVCNTDLMNSWHSWSPNSRWLVFSSKSNTPYTQMFLTHIDGEGNDSPAILVPNSTAANRAVNIPEFVNIPGSASMDITSPAVDYRRLMEKGNRLAQDGDILKAEDTLLKSLALRSDYPDTHANLAYVLNEQGRYAEAIAHCRQALLVEPRFPEAHNNWGNALVKLGRLKEAADRYRLAVSARKGYDSAHINLGRVLSRLGRHDEAVEHFLKALEATPESIAALTALGRELMKLGRLPGAREAFLEAASLDRGSFSAHSGAGDASLRMGRLDEAIESYRRASAIKGGSTAVLNNIGTAYLRKGMIDRAIASYRAAVKADGMSASARHNLATALNEKGMIAEAIASYRKAIELGSSRERSRLALAWLLATTSDSSLRDGTEAVSLAESVMEEKGSADADVYEVLAASYAEIGRFDEAVSITEKLVSNAPAGTDMVFLLEMKRRLRLFRKRRPLRVDGSPGKSR